MRPLKISDVYTYIYVYVCGFSDMLWECVIRWMKMRCVWYVAWMKD